MQCPNCEAENRDDAKFCDECGFPLGGVGARVTQASASPAATIPFPEIEGGEWQDDVQDDFSPEMDEDRAFTARDSGTIDVLSGKSRNQDDEASPDMSSAEHENSFSDSDVTSRFDSGAIGQDVEGEFIDPSDQEWPETEEVDSPVESESVDPFAGLEIDSEDDFDFFGDDGASNAGFDETAEQLTDQTMQMPRVDGEVKPVNRDFRISSTASRRPSKVVFAIVGVVAVAIIAVGVTFALGLWGGVGVPDVTGMTESDARALLEEDGFSVRSTQVKSDDTEGLVLIMDPAGGSRAAEGSEVVIHIATARFVPDIVGKSADDAKALLEDAGYENVRYEMVKSTDSEGMVLSVSPEAGTRAKSSMEVVVGVSEAYRVPDISGLDLEAAEAAIEEGGLVPQVIYVDTQEYPEGTILGTTPEANTKVSEGDYVSINVARARGAELVALTQQLFAPGGTATIGGTSIAVDSVDSVVYMGDDTVSFTITGRPYATLMGETVYGTTQSVTGEVVWSESNEVLSIS